MAKIGNYSDDGVVHNYGIFPSFLISVLYL